jgi:G3E family GTPase
VQTTYGRIAPGEFAALAPRGDIQETPGTTPDLTLQRETVRIDPKMTVAQLTDFLQMLREDTYRMKGILRLESGRYLVDCVGTDVRVSRYAGASENENLLTLMAGEGMPLRQALRAALQRYNGLAVRKIG